MKKKKFNWAALLLFLGSLTVGAALGVKLGEMMVLEDMTFPQMLGQLGLYMLLMLLSIWLQTAIHEAGHLVFGLLTGYGFSSYRLGSLMILKENGKLRLRKLKIAGTGGQCLMTPPELVDGKMPFVLYNLGGCIANLVVGAVAGIGWLLLPQAGLLSVWLLSMAVMGAILALANGIPIRMGLIQNDGKNTLMLWKEPGALRVFYYQLRMTQALAAGVKTKDMPREWFWMPSAEERKNAIGASAGVIYCGWLLDQGRFDEARQGMEELLNGEADLLDLHRRLMTCDLICCELIGQRRWDVVEGLLTKEQKTFMQSMRTSLSVLRTQYLIALIHENDQVKANAWRAQFEKQAKRYPYSSGVESEREWFAIAGERRAITDGI